MMGSGAVNFTGRPNGTGNVLTWTPISTFNVFMLVGGLCTNLSVILLFAKHVSLRTPFTIYLINLLAANTMCSVLYYPLELLNDVYTVWWTGTSICTLYQYASTVAQSAMCNSHVLIAMNRLWAVTYPVSYRQHTKKTAVIACLGMWIYLHVVTVPGLVVDALYYRLPEETNGCQVNTDVNKVWWTTLQFSLYNGPELFIILAYVVVCYQLSKRRLIRIRPTSSSGEASNSLGSRRAQYRQFLCWRVLLRKTDHGFLMLTLMTLTIFVCYTPENLYYTLIITFGASIDSLNTPAAILYELNAVLDPVWFVLALPDFRTAFRAAYVPWYRSTHLSPSPNLGLSRHYVY